MQETVLERRALDLDEIGKLEDALEGARSDAVIQDVAGLLVRLALLLALMVSVFSFSSILSSFSPKPATATEMR